MFDINNLMNTVLEESLSTSSTPVPEGEYIMRIEELKPRTMERRDGSGQIALLTVRFVIDDVAEVTAVTGRKVNSVKMDMFLDITPEGNLDTGKGMNISLGRLRNALGQNDTGKRWSFNSMIGGVVRGLVTHRVTDDGTFAEVKSVRPL